MMAGPRRAGRPDQNGLTSGCTGSLGEEAATRLAPALAAQPARFDAWREDFHANRSHEAVAQPASPRLRLLSCSVSRDPLVPASGDGATFCGEPRLTKAFPRPRCIDVVMGGGLSLVEPGAGVSSRLMMPQV